MSSNWTKLFDERLTSWRKQGLARELKTPEGAGVRFNLRGTKILSFASNDYLDLANHPQVISAAKSALDSRGAGATASPLIVGHTAEHAKLEAALCKFKQSDSALVFASGFHASLATIGALANEETTVILDRLAHASLIDGAKLSGARVRVFKHNDVDDLKRTISAEAPRPVLVVVESLYSMDGDLAPLAQLLEICEQAGALLMVDEAHATGVLGESGRGALEAITTERGALPENVVAMGTLSKALGSQGGFVCASQAAINTIVHSGRAYLFSTALAPSAAAAARAALELVSAEPERRTHLIQLSNSLRTALTRNRFELVPGSGPIIALLCGEEKRSTRWSDSLFAGGIFVPAIRYPTVKKGQARLRISLSSAHTREDCQALIDALKKLKAQAS